MYALYTLRRFAALTLDDAPAIPKVFAVERNRSSGAIHLNVAVSLNADVAVIDRINRINRIINLRAPTMQRGATAKS